jgi:hypothetical protein
LYPYSATASQASGKSMKMCFQQRINTHIYHWCQNICLYLAGSNKYTNKTKLQELTLLFLEVTTKQNSQASYIYVHTKVHGNIFVTKTIHSKSMTKHFNKFIINTMFNGIHQEFSARTSKAIWVANLNRDC